MAATPEEDPRRGWPEAARRWAAGERQIIEGAIGRLKDSFSLGYHRAKTLGGLLARLAAKAAAQRRAAARRLLGRPLRRLADLLVWTITHQRS